jgi:hypothetical protein
MTFYLGYFASHLSFLPLFQGAWPNKPATAKGWMGATYKHKHAPKCKYIACSSVLQLFDERYFASLRATKTACRCFGNAGEIYKIRQN